MSSSSESAQHRPVIFRWIGQDGLIKSDFICAECTPRSLEGVIFFPCPVIEPETTREKAMPSQEVIDGLWTMGAVIAFFGFAGVCALVGIYVNRKWF